jgi:hypothetical protein
VPGALLRLTFSILYNLQVPGTQFILPIFPDLFLVMMRVRTELVRRRKDMFQKSADIRFQCNTHSKSKGIQGIPRLCNNSLSTGHREALAGAWRAWSNRRVRNKVNIHSMRSLRTGSPFENNMDDLILPAALVHSECTAISMCNSIWRGFQKRINNKPGEYVQCPHYQCHAIAGHQNFIHS